MEGRQGQVVGDDQAPPDRRFDVAELDAELVLAQAGLATAAEFLSESHGPKLYRPVRVDTGRDGWPQGRLHLRRLG